MLLQRSKRCDNVAVVIRTDDCLQWIFDKRENNLILLEKQRRNNRPKRFAKAPASQNTRPVLQPDSFFVQCQTDSQAKLNSNQKEKKLKNKSHQESLKTSNNFSVEEQTLFQLLSSPFKCRPICYSEDQIILQESEWDSSSSVCIQPEETIQDRRKESSNFSSKDSLALSQRGAPKSGRTLTAEFNQNSSTTGGSIDKVTVLRMAPITAMPHTEDCLSKENSWEEAVASSYKVRGLNYMTDRKKYDSQDAAYRLLGIELLASTDQNKHISARQGSFVQRYQQAAGNNAPFLLVLNFVLPFGNFLAYFCPNTMGKTPYIGDEKFDSLLRRFIEGSNDFRDKRLKIMPRCVEGPWMVVHAVGGKPAIMGTKIKHNYYSTERYFEIEVDIMTSKAAGAILNAVKNYTNSCSIELAFVLQGENTSELPERVLGCLRFHQLDVVGAVSIDSWEKR